MAGEVAKEQATDSDQEKLNGVSHDISTQKEERTKEVPTLTEIQGPSTGLENAKTDEKLKPSPEIKPKIIEKIEYRSISSGQVVYTSVLDETKTKAKDNDQPVFEIVRVACTHQDKILESDPSSDPQGKGKKKESPSVHGTWTSYIRIHSPAILNALRCVVDYYPGQTLTGDAVTINEPYAVLVHHEEKLTEYRNRFAPGKSDIPEDCYNKNTFEHLGLLQDFVRTRTSDNVARERERYSRETPIVTYDMLWLLFCPGTDVYYDQEDDDDYTPYVVKSVHFQIANSCPTEYTVTLWNLGANSRYMGPKEVTTSIAKFDGEKEMTSMRLYPCEYEQTDKDGKSSDEKRKWFIERGKMFFRLQRKQCMWFDGYSYWYPRRHYASQVMVDQSQLATEDELMRAEHKDLKDIENAVSGISNCACKHCTDMYNMRGRRARFSTYSKIYATKMSELTEHQYFICSRQIMGFVFKIRLWKLLDVAGFSPPSFNQRMIDDLVLASSAKDVIKSLVKRYIRDAPSIDYTGVLTQRNQELKSEQWSADAVAGKGEGLMFLLHGKPGVGKTYTAECIAEHTARPLLTLTCADIGTEPGFIEQRLLYWFKLARNWGAILLIDEADIYMENREIQDLKRNNIVASFLRTLEYFQGILFLTTNRIGTFDEAFISRIHVLLHYRDFTDKERKAVWQVFFKKIEREREHNMRILRATKDYVFEDPEVLALKWNGREIRNAVQIAVSLAEAEGDADEDGRILIKEAHIQATVQMSSAFKGYLKSLYKKDESQMAAMRMIRYDAFEKNTENASG